jgi:nucleotide-binding universal stress UspA family protein
MTDDPAVAVVAGIDGSAAARSAAEWAAADAVLRGAPLRLVHALDHPASASYPSPVLVSPPVTAQMRTWARQLLETTSTELAAKHPGLVVDTAAVDGTPWSVLVDESARASLTVVGSHGGGQLSEVVLGSVASRLTSHAHGSVVIVRKHAGPQASPARPVVVGVDGSAEADGAISFAFGEAALRGCPLVAVHAWNDRPLEHSLAGGPLHLDADAVHAEQQRRLLAHLGRWTRRHPHVEVQPAVLRGKPAAAVLHYLAHAAEPPQLVVVGHRGRGGFARLLLGSTSTALVVHAPCPVVVVRNWADAGT